MEICETDKDIRYGKLPSGLTYYIRHNETPKGLACFYLIKNFGSVIEEDHEKGFAHFLEHISFDGSSHFQDSESTKFLESIGVRFGEECNAYTSADETVYKIDNVPVSEENISNCIQILLDWINALSLTDESIENEKNIILEEFRVASNPMYRMFKAMTPVMYRGSKYAQCNTLGNYDSIKNISHDKLREFYCKWSRPELSAIIIVGDFDEYKLESKLRSFNVQENGGDFIERPEFDVPDNEQPIIAIERDPEHKVGRTGLFFKRNVFDRQYIKTYECLREAYVCELIVRMLNSRCMYIANGPSSPFVDPIVSIGDYLISRTKQSIDLWIDFDIEKFDLAFSTALREIRRAVVHGFSRNELQKAKVGWMTSMESNYLDHANRTSHDFADEYLKHFTHHEPIPSIDDEYDFAKRTIPEISVDEINEIAKGMYVDKNLVVSCFLPSTALDITRERVLDLISSVGSEEITPFAACENINSLISETIPKGEILSKSDFIFGYRKYILSNGVSVYLKTTDFSGDEILLYAMSKGGKYRFDISQYRELFAAEHITDIGGLGDYSKQEIYSFLEDKHIECVTLINPILCLIKGNCAVKNFRELMQIVYLIFTSPRYDADAFCMWKDKMASILKNKEAVYFSETMKMIYQEQFTCHRFYNKPDSSEINAIDYDRAYDLFIECFSNPCDFSFIITGKIDESQLLPYLEQYLAPLETKPRGTDVNYHHLMKDGDAEKIRYVEMESPSSYSITALQNEVPHTLKNIVLMDLLVQTLNMYVIEEVRQKEGDTYLAYVEGNLSLFEPSVAFFDILFQTNVGNETYIHETIDRILQSYSHNGPSDEILTKSKEYSRKLYIKNQEENKYYQEKLSDFLISGIDEITDYELVLDSISVHDLQSFASSIITEGRKKRCVITSK